MDVLDEPMLAYSFGLHKFISSQFMKVSAAYFNRPQFDFDSADEVRQSHRRGMVIVAVQLMFRKAS